MELGGFAIEDLMFITASVLIISISGLVLSSQNYCPPEKDDTES